MTFINSTQVEIMGRQNRNQELAKKTATSYRKRLFTSLGRKPAAGSEKKDGRRFTEDVFETFGLVGYKMDNDCFFPGFFSRNNFVLKRAVTNKTFLTDPLVEESDVNASNIILIPSVPKIPFIPRGKIEKNGIYHPYYIDNEQPSKTVQFPNLRELLKNQTSEPHEKRLTLQEQIHLRRSGLLQKNLTDDGPREFQLCLRNGPEIKITELLGSGVWHMVAADEYFVAGIFDFQGRFVAAYYLSKYGFMIPGASDSNHNRFIPSCPFNLDSERLMVPEKPLHEDLLQEFYDITHVIQLPKAEDLRIPGQKKWVCVKDAVFMADPLSITILSDAVFGEHIDINIYAGGDIASDGQLYLYGKYSRDGLFIPGK